MTATFSPAEAARLAAELLEDDARMTPGPWRRSNGGLGVLADHFEASGFVLHVNYVTPVSDAAGIARLRNNARGAAEQLEAALKEVERLKRDLKFRRYFDIGNRAIDRLTERLETEAEGTPLAALASDAATNIHQLQQASARAEAERDEARAEVNFRKRENDVLAECATVFQSERDKAVAEVARLSAAAERGVSPNAYDSLVMYAKRADETFDMLIVARAERDAARAEAANMRQAVEAAEAFRDQPMLVKGDAATWGDVAQSHTEGPRLLGKLIKAVDAYRAGKP